MAEFRDLDEIMAEQDSAEPGEEHDQPDAPRVTVKFTGDPARFLAGHKAAGEAASKLLAGRFAEQAAQTRQFHAQFAGVEAVMRRNAEIGKAIVRQIAPIAPQLAAISSTLKPALDQVAGLKLGMSPAKFAGFGLDLGRVTPKITVNPKLTGWEKSGFLSAFQAFKPVLERYQRAEQLLRKRLGNAEELLDQLDDVPFRDVVGPLEAIASGDRRQIRIVTVRLKARARRYPVAGKLLAWVEAAREYVLATLDVAREYVRWLRHGPRDEDEQARPRRAVKRLGAPPRRASRRPERHSRALALLGRACTITNANAAASVMEAVAA